MVWYLIERVAFAMRYIIQTVGPCIAIHPEAIWIACAGLVLAVWLFALRRRPPAAWVVVGNVAVSRAMVCAADCIFVVRPRINTEGVVYRSGVYIALVDDVPVFCEACARAWGVEWVQLAGRVSVSRAGVRSLRGVVAVVNEEASWMAENGILLVPRPEDVMAIATACSAR